MYSPEQQRDPGITVVTINLPFQCISKARDRPEHHQTVTNSTLVVGSMLTNLAAWSRGA